MAKGNKKVFQKNNTLGVMVAVLRYKYFFNDKLLRNALSMS